MIIGLIAQKQVGKDTFADHLLKRGDFTRYGFADSIKEACKTIFCLTDRQVNGDLKEVVDKRWGMSPREMFITIGSNMFREHLPFINEDFNKEIGDEIWVRRFEFWYETWRKENPEKHLVVSDVRFMDEARIIRNMGGILVGIQGKVHYMNTTISEMLINIWPCNFYIENKGTLDEYYEKIDKLMEEL